MPSCKQLKDHNDNDEEVYEKNQKQLTTKELNENRLITKVRMSFIFIFYGMKNIISVIDKVYH